MNQFVNIFKTGILFAVLTALFLTVGYFIGGQSGAILFFAISLVMNLGSYWFSDKIALAMAKASPIEESQAPGIYADVRDLSQRMGLPMPRIYATSDMQPNAFATGRNPSHSVIAVTQGLLSILDRNEVRGVLAHELGHIKNRDVLISTIAAVFAGTISSLANIALFLPMGGDNEDRNPLAGLLMAILAPIAALFIQMAISRSREYAADATGAEYTGKPQDLANALVKIDSAVSQIPMNVNPSLSSLYIENPFKGGGMVELLSTHPSTENRVARLMEMSQSSSQ